MSKIFLDSQVSPSRRDIQTTIDSNEALIKSTSLIDLSYTSFKGQGCLTQKDVEAAVSVGKMKSNSKYI